jgi:hypothetical protein
MPNRSPGEDNVILKMIIHAGLELNEELYKLIKQIRDAESIPLAWKTGLIFRIHKKWVKSDCNNYRGITFFLNTSLINMRTADHRR